MKKVPKIIGRFHLIHSVDSVELARKISECSLKQDLVTDILIQVNISGEKTKHGFSIQDLKENYKEMCALSNLHIKGLMTMAPYTNNIDVVKECFAGLRGLSEKLGINGELSMGMSHDFKEALFEGATLLRIGSLIFN